MSNSIIPSAWIIPEKSRRTSDGHDTDILRPEKSKIVLRILPLPSFATLSATILHRHKQCRSSYGVRFALASRTFSTKSSSSYYFETYGIVPLVTDIQAFLRRNCTVADYNKRQLQGLRSTVCGKYCCLFALYMDLGYSPQQLVGLFDDRDADAQTYRLFEPEFRPLRLLLLRGRGQCSASFL